MPVNFVTARRSDGQLDLDRVVDELARIIRATVSEHNGDLALASEELDRRLVISRSVFATISEHLEGIARDVFPRDSPERAVAMFLANHMDAADAAAPPGSPIHLAREGFVWKPEA